MQNLTRRLDRLEQIEDAASPPGMLTLVSWIPRLGSTPRRARYGEVTLEREGGEGAEEFIARVKQTFRPATGFRAVFVDHA